MKYRIEIIPDLKISCELGYIKPAFIEFDSALEIELPGTFNEQDAKYISFYLDKAKMIPYLLSEFSLWLPCKKITAIKD